MSNQFDFEDDGLEAKIAEANKNVKSLEELEEMTQGTPGWFRLRMGMFTGSKFPALMTGGRAKGQAWGETAYGVIRQVYLERDLTDIGMDLYVEELAYKEFRQTKWGKEYEAYARNLYEELTGHVVEETFFQKHNILEMVGGSSDGKVFEVNKILEVKCPYDPLVHMANCELTAIDEKHKYYAQIQGNIEIMGADSCDFVSFDIRRTRDVIKIINVPRDQDFIDRLFKRIAIAERAVHYMGLSLSCEDAVLLAEDEIGKSN